MTRLVPLALVSFLASGSPAPEDPVPAPDGERGLGSESSLTEILRIFRQPEDEDEQFLRELTELQGQVGTFEALLEEAYGERGYLDLVALDLEGGESQLDAFHRVVRRFLDAPQPALAATGPKARRWAEVLLDARLRVRAEVLRGWRRDAREVRHGLTLLRANEDGWVRMTESEVRVAAARVDLAAALLRARVKDLSALREERTSTEVPPAEVTLVLEIAQLPAGKERQDQLDAVLRRMRDHERGMRDLLFLARLEASAAEWIRWRAKNDERAGLLRQEVRAWRPDTDEGAEAPAEIRGLKKTDRRREAFGRATLGLASDPFDEELAFAAGRMAEYVSGREISIDYFDRFLALRGIRSHDDRNWRGRELNEDEEHALFQVQSYARERQGLPEPPPD